LVRREDKETAEDVIKESNENNPLPE